MAQKKHHVRDRILALLHHSRCTTDFIWVSLGKKTLTRKTLLHKARTLHGLGLIIYCESLDEWEREEDPPHVGVIAYLNIKTGCNFRPWKPDGFTPSTNANFILDRLEEGVTIEQMFEVINMKAKEWLGTKQQIYLRPQTLFNQSHCETYVAQLPMPKQASGPSSWAKERKG